MSSQPFSPPPSPTSHRPIELSQSSMLRDRSPGVEMTLTLLRHSLQRYDRYQEQLLRPYNLTPAQFTVLQHLRQSHTPLPMGSLATQLHLSHATLTGLVKRLEAKGWIDRQPHPDDRRCILLSLTPAGIRLSDRADRHCQDQHLQAFRPFDLNELNLLRVLLSKLEQTLEQALRI